MAGSAFRRHPPAWWLEAPWIGAVGGLLASIEGTIRYSRGDWLPRFNYWHPLKPLMGAASGAVACLLVIVLLRAASGSNTPSTDPTTLDAAAFTFGYAESAFRQLIKAVTDVFIKPGPTAGSTRAQTPPRASSSSRGPAASRGPREKRAPRPARAALRDRWELAAEHVIGRRSRGNHPLVSGLVAGRSQVQILSPRLEESPGSRQFLGQSRLRPQSRTGNQRGTNLPRDLWRGRLSARAADWFGERATAAKADVGGVTSGADSNSLVRMLATSR
jgi:hypothetical protein